MLTYSYRLICAQDVEAKESGNPSDEIQIDTNSARPNTLGYGTLKQGVCQ
ncbi:MAG TPA: hypothetical protein VF088_09345 [Pyrinomonadaceae bacterium]